MNIGVNNYSNYSYKYNNLKNVINVPMIAEEIFGALPPADQTNLSSTCKDARLSLQSIMNIRLGGIFGSSNIFNKLSKVTERHPSGINKNAGDTLKRLIKKISLDYGVKKPQYDLVQIIEWFKSIDLLEGTFADYLTWEDLQELGLFSHEDWVVAAQSATQELAQVTNQLLQTIALAAEAAGVELMGFAKLKAGFAQRLQADQELVNEETLSTLELMDIALDIQAEASAVQLARIAVEAETVPLEEKIVEAIEVMQSLPIQKHDVYALGPNRIHREIIEENIINIISFGKRVNLINYLGINISEYENEEGNNVISLGNYAYELGRLVDLINNEEMPFPVGIIRLFFLDYVKDEIEKGNESAKKCLQKINNPNTQDKNKSTLLHWAANTKKWEVASILLNAAANPDIKDIGRKTPLHWAAAFAPEEDFSLFLAKSTDLNAQDDGGRTALQWAVDSNNWGNVRLLLKAEANLNTVDEIGRMPLHWVAQTEENSIMQLFLDEGAHVGRKDKFDNTSLHYALNRQNIEGATILLNGNSPIDVKNSMKDTPLHLLVKTRNTELVKLALEKGKYKNLTATNKAGESALDLALLSNNKKIGLLLLKKGAQPNKYTDKLFFYRLLFWRLQAFVFRIPSINAQKAYQLR